VESGSRAAGIDLVPVVSLGYDPSTMRRRALVLALAALLSAPICAQAAKATPKPASTPLPSPSPKAAKADPAAKKAEAKAAADKKAAEKKAAKEAADRKAADKKAADKEAAKKAAKDAADKKAAAREAARKADPATEAAYGKFGMGISLGEPLSATMKIYLDDWSSFGAGVGWSVREEGLAVNADYLFNLRNALYLYGNEMPPMIGAGVLLTVPRETGPAAPPTRIRLRFPLGLSFRPRTAPVELGAEIVPMWEIHPGTVAAERYAWSAAGTIRIFF
jgi:hypothetical protein